MWEHDIQSWLPPHEIHFLVYPILAFIAKLHIKVPKHAGHNRSHFVVCKTRTESLALSHLAKGCGLIASQYNFVDLSKGIIASFTSVRNSSGGSGNQRSGTDISGSWKLVIEWHFAQVTFPGAQTPAIVFPSGRVPLGKAMGKGGYMRRASSMQACRHGSCPAEVIVITSAVLNALRIYSWTLA